MGLDKQGEFSFKHVEQPDMPMPGAITPSEWKEKLDSQADELKTTVNKLIEDLEAKVGTSGAEQIGSKAITDLTGDNIFSILKDLRDKLRSSTGADFIKAASIAGLNGDTVQAIVASLKSLVDVNDAYQTNTIINHKSSTDHDGRYNTKTELSSTSTGTSGTRRIFGEALNGISAGTLHSQLTALKKNIDETATGGVPDGAIPDEKLSDNPGQVKARLTETENDLNMRGLNIMKLDMGVVQDGTDTAQTLYDALKYCRENGYSAFIPKGTYTVGPITDDKGTDWKCIPVPEGLTVYIETGVIFKLKNNAPPTTRVLVPGDNVSIHGHLEIDGSSETITVGNEHMAGLFLYGCKNVYIQSLYAYNCYGDNVQISGDSSNFSDNIKIDFLRCRKARRNNLTFETANGVHIGRAILNNSEGLGVCLDIEPFSLGNLTYYNRIDYLETDKGNEVTAGTTAEAASQYRLDIGTLIQKNGNLVVYASTLNIDNAHFSGTSRINMEYAADVTIRKAHFKSPSNRVISALNTGDTPRLHIDYLYIQGSSSTTPSGAAIMWQGSRIYIGQMLITNYNHGAITSQYTAESELHINELISINSGNPSGNLIYLDYYLSRGSCTIGHLVVRDKRGTKIARVITFNDPESMNDFKLLKVHNPDNITLYNAENGNFTTFFKMAGIDNGVSIFMVSGSPEGAITAPVGSLAMRTNGGAGTTLYVKESGVGNTGWVAK